LRRKTSISIAAASAPTKRKTFNPQGVARSKTSPKTPSRTAACKISNPVLDLSFIFLLPCFYCFLLFFPVIK
jgi:hypothetical protein